MALRFSEYYLDRVKKLYKERKVLSSKHSYEDLVRKFLTSEGSDVTG